MPFDSEFPWSPTDSQLFRKGKNIGLPHGEYKKWAKRGFHVLEVGTGTDASALRSLLDDKISVIGIEPGMNYPDERYKKLRNDPVVSQRIAPLNAVDAIDHPLMPAEGVDVVFAQNANFAQYTHSRAEFFAQLHGLVRCLKKDNKDSYVTFLSIGDDLIFNTIGDNPQTIDLPKILNDLQAKWTTRESESGLKCVVIYRTNDKDQDITERLESYIKTA